MIIVLCPTPFIQITSPLLPSTNESRVTLIHRVVATELLLYDDN